MLKIPTFATVLLLSIALQTATAQPQPSKAQPKGDQVARHAAGLAVLQPDSFAVFKLDPVAARSAPLAKLIESQMPLTELIREMGRDPETEALAKIHPDIEVIWVGLSPPVLPTVTIYARFKDAAALDAAMKALHVPAEFDTVEFGGANYCKPKDHGPMWLREGREFYIAFDQKLMENIITSRKKLAETPLATKLKTVNLDADFVAASDIAAMPKELKEMVQVGVADAPVPHFKMAADLLDKADWAAATVDLTDANLVDIDVDLQEPANAEELVTIVKGLVAAGKLALKNRPKVPPEHAEKEASAERLVRANLNAISATPDAEHVDVAWSHVPELDKELPAILAAAREASDQAKFWNRAHRVGQGMMMRRVKNEKFDLKDVAGKTGKPLLSWRVAMLEYVESEAKLEPFDLEQAWDSEKNKANLGRMPDVFKSPSATEPNTTTWKLLPHGEGLGFSGSEILMIDGGKGTAVPWTKPDGFKIDPADPLAAFGEPPPSGYVALFADGHVGTIKPEQLKQYLQEKFGKESPESKPETTSPERVWKDATGKTSVKAALVEVQGDNVTLLRSDNGKQVTLPLSKLSKEDQEYLKSLSP